MQQTIQRPSEAFSLYVAVMCPPPPISLTVYFCQALQACWIDHGLRQHVVQMDADAMQSLLPYS